MDIFGLFLSALTPEDQISQTPNIYDRILSEHKAQNKSINPLNQNVPQNMQKMIENFQNSNSDPNEFINSLIKTNQTQQNHTNFLLEKPKQISNIILTTNNVYSEPLEEKPVENIFDFQIKSGNHQEESKLEEKNDQTDTHSNNVNEFLLLSKVATLYNQLNNEEKLQKKEKMEKKLRTKSESEGDNDSEEGSRNKSLKTKKIKKVNWGCGHFEKEHYAKNLCTNCYRKYGRTKKPWNCCHSKLYAHGLCQNCYINKYNQIKKFKTNIMLNPEILNNLTENINLEDINLDYIEKNE